MVGIRRLRLDIYNEDEALAIKTFRDVLFWPHSSFKYDR